MQVRVGARAGFCMGVRRALSSALEAALRRRGRIFTLGPLIHNTQVVELLRRRHVEILARPEDVAPGDLVVIRAHGVPPESMAAIEERGGMICDATCPHVTRAQNTVKKAVEAGAHVIIVGDRGHAEVTGLLGFAGGKGHVVENPEEAASLPPMDFAWVVAQTTQAADTFAAVAEAVRARVPRVEVAATICGSTSGRQEEVIGLAHEVDVMVVVGGKHSANTVRLAEISRRAGVPTVLVETADELDPAVFKGCRTAGVTAGASTPNWIIDEVVERLRLMGRGGPPGAWLRAACASVMASHVFVAGGAAALAYAAARLAGVAPGVLPPVLAGLYLFAMQNLNMYIEHRQGDLVTHRRRALYARFGHIMAPLGALSAIASLVLAWIAGPVPFTILALSTLLGALYSVRLAPRAWRYQRLKDIPGSKNVFFAGALAVVSVLVPATADGGAFAPTWALGLAFAWTVTLALARSITLDMQNMQSDQFACRETIPVVLGHGPTKLLIGAGAALCLAGFLCAAALGAVPAARLWYLVALVHVALYLLVHKRRLFAHGMVFECIVDSSFYVPALIAALL
ncbi:MAG TPA: 4-hydroxy-3-methylbut-2-enyl diphosphate reductase [Planctomycetes bacterium]|nr:4-hydroxy-3-methylbut-2-enyl diphosphate reductase [Planctomycetota bacterium]